MEPGADPLHLYVARGEVPWEERDGRVLVAIPKDQGPVGRLVGKLLRAPEAVSVRLDEAGTAMWLLADGTRTGEEIAEELGKRFGGTGWAARTKSFLDTLFGRGLLLGHARPTKAVDRLAGFPRETGFRAATCRRCSTTVRVKGSARVLYQCPGCGRMTRAAKA